jgi:hypothetical protein
MPVTKTTRRVSRSSPCPICRKADWCRVAANGAYAICNRVESPTPARGNGGGWIHRLDGQAGARPATPRYHAPAGAPAAPPSRRSLIHGRLVSHLDLSEQHKQQLLARGFSANDISNRSYRSLPLRGRAAFCRAVADGDDGALEGVPGFFQKDGGSGPYWTLAGSPGLLIPCCGPRGDVRGLRIRPDDQGAGGKYRWLSSDDRPGGASSGAHCHVARPAVGGLLFDRTVWITEGELKADYAADKLRAVVLSVPGVSSWTLALADLRELLPDDGRVVVAFDADWREKIQVHAAMWDIAQACNALGYNVEIATWDSALKGLDDLLATGRQPTRTSLAALPEPVWAPRLSSRKFPPRLPVPAAETINLNEMRRRRRPALALCA